MARAEMVAFGDDGTLESTFLHQYYGNDYNTRPQPADLFWEMDTDDGDENVTISRPLSGKLERKNYFALTYYKEIVLKIKIVVLKDFKMFVLNNFKHFDSNRSNILLILLHRNNHGYLVPDCTTCYEVVEGKTMKLLFAKGTVYGGQSSVLDKGQTHAIGMHTQRGVTSIVIHEDARRIF